MAQLKVSRTLVKSSPELWAECSDAASLARHLGAFGEIQITKLEPETAVAWEGEDVCGTVTLEPSGWGTRVVLTATVEGVDASSAEVAPAAEAADPATEAPTPAVGVGEPAADLAVAPAAGLEDQATVEPARPGLLRRLLGGWRKRAEPVSAPAAEELTDADLVPAPAASPVKQAAPAPAATAAAAHTAPVTPTAEPDSPSADALVGALDSLGRAHRRPFSHG